MDVQRGNVLEAQASPLLSQLVHSSFARMGGNMTKIILFRRGFFSILAIHLFIVRSIRYDRNRLEK
jgi:hypothetical protein